MGIIIGILGLTTAIVGFALEALAVAAIASYPVRRFLPMSPVYVLCVGGNFFIGGVVLAAIGYSL